MNPRYYASGIRRRYCTICRLEKRFNDEITCGYCGTFLMYGVPGESRLINKRQWQSAVAVNFHLYMRGVTMGTRLEFTPYTFTEPGDTLSGKLFAVVREPWPAIVIDDGGALFGVGTCFQIVDYFKRTKLPIGKGVVFNIKFIGQAKTRSGMKVNKYDLSVDENTLPKGYDKTLLQPEVLDPAEMSDTLWDELYNTKSVKDEQEAAASADGSAKETPPPAKGKKHKQDDLPF